MDKKSLKLAKQLKKEIAKEYKVLDMRLFGSRARDDFEEDSDLDIFVELEDNNPEIRKFVRHLSWKIGFENDIVIMTLIITKDRIENGPMRYSPIYRNIEKDGVAV